MKLHEVAAWPDLNVFSGLLYNVWRPVSHDILLSIFEMFHWPLD